MTCHLTLKSKGEIMKIIILVLFVFIVACNSQPNTSTTIEVGIVSPQPDKTYLLFVEVDTDTLSARLFDDMDYLSPNVSDLIVNISSWTMIGDTLFGEITYPDLTYIRFVKGGLVQVNDFTNKYSAMRTSYWTDLDAVEPLNAGFIFRRK